MRRYTAPRRAMPAVLAVLAAGALAVSMVACGGSATPNPLTPATATLTTLPSNDEMLSEKTQGNASSPNTIIYYLSFWSGQSRDFYLTGDGVQIKAQIVDAGKARLIFRNLFTGVETLTAAMLARCAGDAKFFDAVNTIFSNQATWLGSSDPDTGVQRTMLGFGMSQPVVNACLGDATLQNGIRQIHIDAVSATYFLPDGTQRAPTATTGSILAVPALVVNGVLLDGRNNDQSVNAAFQPTLANVQQLLNLK